MHYRTIWISDVHLGTSQCKAEELLSFLRDNDCETLFLVGDILDFWALEHKWYFPVSHNTVIQKLLRKARAGTKVIYIVGNHDSCLRDFIPMSFGNIEVVNDYIYTLLNNKKLYCFHGDSLDFLVRMMYNRTIMLLVRNTMRTISKIVSKSFFERFLQFNRTDKFNNNFITAALEEMKLKNCDMVLTGHSHMPTINNNFLNTGDWVNSCSAIVEHLDGKLELIKWK